MDPDDPISIFADMNLNSDDFFQILETHRKSCQREGRFDEAELTRLRILELRAHEEQTKKNHLKARHKAEKASLLEAHKLEIEKLNETWSTEIMPKFEESAKIAVMQMQEKQKAEMEEMRKRQEIELEKIKSHPPSEILTLRKKMDTFAAAGEYTDAKKVKAQLFELENDWAARVEDKLRGKWGEQIEKLVDKQEKETRANFNKLDKQRQLKIMQWRKDEELLSKRYNNVKSDLLNQQKIEKQKLTKEFSVKRQAMESISSKSKRPKDRS
jgi:hypothetical protein